MSYLAMHLKRYLILAAFAVTLVAADCLFFANTAKADSAIQLQNQLHRMQSWMGSGRNAQNWRLYLNLSVLESEIVKGHSADLEKLRAVQAKFKSGAAGLNHPIFKGVADALDAHIENLQAASQTDVPQAFANAKYRDVNAELLKAHRNIALHELNLLKAYYSKNMGDQAASVIRDLDIDNLFKLIAEDVGGNVENADERRKIMTHFANLTQTARKLRIEKGVGRNDAFYPIAKDAVDRYLLAFRAMVLNARYKTAFANNIANLKKVYDSIGSNRGASKALGVQIGQLEDTFQAPVLITLIRQKLTQPNIHFSISESLVNQLGSQDLNDTQPVNENILGRQVYGTATTTGKVLIDFVEDPNQAHVSLRLRGQTHSNSYTKEGPITAFANACAEVEARRSVLANIGGLQAFDSYVAACLSSSFQGTDSFRIVTKIAEKQYQKTRNDSDAVAAYRAEVRLKRQFDEQTDDVLTKGSTQLANGRAKTRQRLIDEQSKIQNAVATELNANHANRFRLLEPRLSLRTTHDSLIVSGTARAADQMAAFSTPPASQSKAGITIQIHESFLSNILSDPFKGDTYSNKDIPGLVKAIAPDAEPVKMEGDDNFSISFDRGLPIQVQFDKGQITILFAARSFRNKGTNYNQPFFVKQTFNLVKDEGLKLVGAGLPQVEFQVPGQKNAGEVAFRKLLQDRIGEAIKESGKDKLEIKLPPNLIPPKALEQMEDPTLAKGLQLVEFESNNGWLTIGYNMDPKVRLPRQTQNTGIIQPISR